MELTTLPTIAAAIAVVGMLLGSLLHRFGRPAAFWIQFAAQTLMRLTFGVILGVTAVVVAGKGGVWFIALAVVLTAMAAFAFVVSGLLIWWAVHPEGLAAPDD